MNDRELEAWIEEPYQDPPWIPCEEQMPKHEDGWVLVVAHPPGHKFRIEKAYYDEDDKIWHVFGWMARDWVVTHWMPLPDLPKEIPGKERGEL